MLKPLWPIALPLFSLPAVMAGGYLTTYKWQTESELPNEEVVSEEQEMLLAMKEEMKDIITSSSMVDVYRQGCDDFYRNQAAHRKEQLDKIVEYLHYTMAPFIE